MDNNKSKDDLRAAGKKKLELFRSKQKKAAASKVAASSPKLASGAGSHAGGSTKHAQIEQHLSTGEDNLGIGHSDASRDVEIPDSRTDRADTLDISVENENTKTNEFLACEQNELAAELCHDMQGQEPLPLDKTNAYTEQGYAEGMNEDLQGQGSQEPCPMDNSMQAEQEAGSSDQDKGCERKHVTEQSCAEKSLTFSDKFPVETIVKLTASQAGKTQCISVVQEIHDDALQHSLLLSAGPEELRKICNDIMKEKDKLLLELECSKTQHLQSIEDRNKLVYELGAFHHELQEVGKEKLRFEMHLRGQIEKLSEERCQLLKDLKDYTEQLHNIVAENVRGESDSTSLNGHVDLSYPKCQLEGEIGRLAFAFEEINRQLHVTSIEKAGLVVELDHVQQLLETRTKERDELIKMIEEATRSMCNLKEENAQMTTELILTQQQTKQLHEIESHLKLGLSDSQQQLQCAVRELEVLASKVEELELQLKRADDGNAEVDRKLEGTYQELLKVNLEKEGLAGVVAEHEENIMKLSRREKEMHLELADMQSQIEITEVEKKCLVKRLEDCTHLVGKMEDMELQLVEMRSHVDKVNSERSHLVDELDHHKMKLSVVVNERDGLANDLEKTKEELQKLVDGTKQQESEITEERLALQDQLYDLTCQLSELANRNNGLAVDLNAQIQQSGKMRAYNAELSQRLQEVQNELSKVAADRVELLNSLEDSKGNARQAEDHVSKLVSELSEIQKQILSYDEERGQLVVDLNKQAELAMKSEKHITDLMSEVSHFQGERDKLVFELASSELQITILEDEKAGLVYELQEICNELQKLQESNCKVSTELDVHKKQISEAYTQLDNQLKNDAGQLIYVHEVNHQNNDKEELQRTQEVALELEHESTEVTGRLVKGMDEDAVLGELQPLQQQVIVLIEHNNLLTKELEVSHQYVHELEQRRLSLEAKLTLFEEQRWEVCNENANLSHQVEDLTHQVDLLNAAKAEVSSQLEKERQSLQSCKEELVQCYADLGVNQQLSQALEMRNTALKNDLEESFLHIQKLLENSYKCAIDLESSKVQLIMVNEENSRFLLEIQHLKQKYQAIQEEKTQLTSGLEDSRYCCKEAVETTIVLNDELYLMQQKPYILNDDQVLQNRGASLELVTSELEGRRHGNVQCAENLNAAMEQLSDMSSRNESMQTELKATMQDLQQQIVAEDTGQSELAWKARCNVKESRTSQCDNASEEVLAGGSYGSSSHHIASGVSKLIKVFEQRGQSDSRDASIVISECQPCQASVEMQLLPIQMGFEGKDSSLMQNLEELSQTEQLAQSEEERECLTMSLSQMEIDANLHKQQIEDLENRLASLAEMNHQLVEQIGIDTDNMKSLKNQILELQEKVAEQHALLQVRGEDLEKQVVEQALSLQGERATYVVALDCVAHKLENGLQSISSDSLAAFCLSDIFPGQDITVEDITKKMHHVEVLCDNLNIWYGELSHRLAATQKEQDAAVMTLDHICTKLCELHQLNTSASGKYQPIECLSKEDRMETEGCGNIGKMDFGLNSLIQECNSVIEELQITLKGKMYLEDTVRDLKAALCTKESDIHDLTGKFDELAEKYNVLCSEAARDAKEKLDMQSELEQVQKMFTEDVEAHSKLALDVDALAAKVYAVIGNGLQNHADSYSSRNGTGVLDAYMAILLEKYDIVLGERESLEKKTQILDQQFQSLKEVVVLKESEVNQLRGRVLELSAELATASKERERTEFELTVAEQKLAAVREKLSLAVTKGKGLIQQRDALKQSLAEKTEEIERLIQIQKQELQMKETALQEAELKLRSFAESGERIEALESELAYIRSSANGLRESFLQKDAVLQKLEELLDGMNLPEVESADVVEKLEWLVRIYNETQKNYIQQTQEHFEGMHGPFQFQQEASQDKDALGRESAQQKQEIEDLTGKNKELLHKYNGLAEQLAMLEQSLLERNYLIQRWEELLDNIDVPTPLRSREPEDKIVWLGNALAEAQNLMHQFQNETHVFQEAIDILTHERNELMTKLAVQRQETERLAMELENLTQKHERLVEDLDHISHETLDRVPLEAEISVLQRRVAELEASQEMQQGLDPILIAANVQSIVSEVLQETDLDYIFSNSPVNTIFEISTRMLVDKCKTSFDEIERLQERLLEVEKEKEDYTKLEQELQSVQDALFLKDLETSDLCRKINESTSTMASQETEISKLLQQTSMLTDEINSLKDERESLQSELSLAEKRLSSTREKLSLAVKKGKSVVHQHNEIKQSLDEKNSELVHVKRELQARDSTLHDTEKRLRQLEIVVEQLEKLELELKSSRDYSASMEKSLQENNRVMQNWIGTLDALIPKDLWLRDSVEKLKWISHKLEVTENRAGFYEEEANKSKKVAELLELELTEAQGRIDDLETELKHAEKNMSVLLGEKKAAEENKFETEVRLEHAIANLNSLQAEVNSLKEFKAAGEHEIISLRNALTNQIEDLQQREQAKADQRQRVLARLHGAYSNLKGKQVDFLVSVANAISRKDDGMRRLKALAGNITNQLANIQDCDIDITATLDFCNNSLEESPFVWNTESWANHTVLTAEIATKLGNTVVQEAEDLETSLLWLCEEMEMSLNDSVHNIKDVVTAFEQEILIVSSVLVQISKGCECVAHTTERLKRDACFVADFEVVRQRKDQEILELQTIIKSLVVTANSAIQELELLIPCIATHQEKKMQLISDDSYQSSITGLDNLNQEEFGVLKKAAVDVSKKLLLSIRNLSWLEQQKLARREEELTMINVVKAEKERECEGLKSKLANTEAAIQNLNFQQESNISKIKDLEKTVAVLQSECLSLRQQLQNFEVDSASVKSSKEELVSLQRLLLTKTQEQECLVKSLDEAEINVQIISKKTEELERDMHQKDGLIESLKASRAKALNRLSTTMSKLDDLRKLSEGLLLELENLHSLLESRDMEVSQLKQNLVNAQNEVLSLKGLVDGNSGFMMHLKKRLEQMALGFNIQDRVTNSDFSEEDLEDTELQQLVEALDKRRICVLADAETLLVQLERKDLLLHDMQARLEEQAGKMKELQEDLDGKQVQIERLSVKLGPPNSADSIAISSEIEDMRGKHLVPLNPIASHVLSARKSSAVDHMALDVDTEPGKTELDTDDNKGHVFRSLISSRFIPKATRLLMDWLDGFWVAGGRVLMRQPEARLGLIMYWLALHVWMVVLLL